MKNTLQFTFSHQPIARKAFSLIELMVVIVVIAILLALLLPAIGNAVTTAREAEVIVDIANIEKAIADFKLKFGVEPPSRLVLVENGPYDTGDADQRKTVALFRQMWPNYNASGAGNHFDFDGDGSHDDNTAPKVLNGSECLVFFLLGPDLLNTTGASTGANNPGFSQNPSNPFASGGNRVGPFLSVDLARLQDRLTTSGSDIVPGTNSMNEYYDPIVGQLRPYAYFGANGGRGYDEVNDLNFDTLTAFYRTGSANTTPKHNAQTYQIISPGFDFEYGTGGEYDGERITDAARSNERDNITNFSGGRLN